MQNIEFDKKVKELMDGHLEMPGRDSWNRLELALIRKRARVVYFRRGIYTSFAVAASLLLLLVLGKESPVPATIDNIGNKGLLVENISKPIIQKETTYSEIISHENKEEKKVKVKLEKRAKETGKEIAQKGKEIVQTGKEIVQNMEQKTGPPVVVSEVVKEVDKKSEKIADYSKNTDKSKNPDKNKNNEKSVTINKGQLYDFEEEPIAKKSFTKGLLYAFSTNLSPTLYNKSISMLSVSLGYQNDFIPINLKETLPQQSMSNSRYAMPLSFGLQAQLPLNNRLSIGAGLNYSLLVSQYNNVEYINTQDVQQSLHYIGVPVNAYYSLLRNKQLNLYLAAGMTLEKGIVANYRIVENGIKRNENFSVPGVQFSVSGGLGAELMLNKELGLYFDPSIAYFFKCNQPENIRTAQQLQYKVELGMRFHM